MRTPSILPSHLFSYRLGIAAIILACAPGVVKAADRNPVPINQNGATMIDARGQSINFDRAKRETVSRAKRTSNHGRLNLTQPVTLAATPTPRPQPTPAPRPTPRPPPVGTGPFWQYAVFGSDIGAS